MRLPTGWYAIARALGHRNFGTYVAGNSVSLIGTWMQRIGVGWLAWELSHSGAVLGLVAFADLFPTVLIGPFGGVLADRADRLRVIKIAQSLIMLQAFALFVLTWSGLITVEILIALVLVQGVVIGFNQPARLALIPSLLPRAELPTAVAINSIVFNTARFIGPALAGLIIVGVGVAVVFAFNALRFVAFLLALSRLRIERQRLDPARRRSTVLGAVWEGMSYAMAHPGIGPILVLHLVIAVCARPFVELLPGFAAQVFDRGASGLAILSSSIGLGAIAGGLWLAQRGRPDRQTTTALASALLVALSSSASRSAAGSRSLRPARLLPASAWSAAAWPRRPSCRPRSRTACAAGRSACSDWSSAAALPSARSPWGLPPRPRACRLRSPPERCWAS
jgi:MFS family permease